jgi:anti-repressor protein
MNQLIPVVFRDISGSSVQTSNARDLWAFVQSKQEFSNWIKARIEKFGFVEGQDFTVDKFINGRATITDYHLTIDMAKELAMVENNEKGREVRRYFIECEQRAKAAQPAFPVPANFAEALRLAADQHEKIEAQQLALKKAHPKVELVDNFLATSNGKAGDVVAKELSKEFDIGRNRMYKFLKEQGIFDKRGVPYQQHIDAGRFYMQPGTYATTDGDMQCSSVRFTSKGEFFVRHLLNKHGYAKKAWELAPALQLVN